MLYVWRVIKNNKIMTTRAIERYQQKVEACNKLIDAIIDVRELYNSSAFQGALNDINSLRATAERNIDELEDLES